MGGQRWLDACPGSPVPANPRDQTPACTRSAGAPGRPQAAKCRRRPSIGCWAGTIAFPPRESHARPTRAHERPTVYRPTPGGRPASRRPARQSRSRGSRCSRGAPRRPPRPSAYGRHAPRHLTLVPPSPTDARIPPDRDTSRPPSACREDRATRPCRGSCGRAGQLLDPIADYGGHARRGGLRPAQSGVQHACPAMGDPAQAKAVSVVDTGGKSAEDPRQRLVSEVEQAAALGDSGSRERFPQQGRPEDGARASDR